MPGEVTDIENAQFQIQASGSLGGSGRCIILWASNGEGDSFKLAVLVGCRHETLLRKEFKLMASNLLLKPSQFILHRPSPHVLPPAKCQGHCMTSTRYMKSC